MFKCPKGRAKAPHVAVLDGKDSYEYGTVDGTRKSDRTHPIRKTSSVAQISNA